MWRVYVIFTAGPKPNQTVRDRVTFSSHVYRNACIPLQTQLFTKIIRDWHLGMFVTALVVVDLILLGIVLTLPFARDLATLVPNEEHPFDEEGVS